MKIILSGIVLIVCMIGLPVFSSAQNNQDSIRYRVETTDGNEYVGKIIERSSDKIRIKTEKLGEISILNNDVKKISEVSAVVKKDGYYWFDNPQSTRYFWVPNGYSLKKGEGYYQNVWILGNQAFYGFTNHLSGGIGMLPLFLFAGAPTPVWVTLKYSVPVVKDKFNAGAGALVGTVLGAENTSFGILYGVTTFGSRDKNLSIGLGWAFAGGEIAKKPTINVSGMIRTGPKGYFLTENYFIGSANNFMVLMSVGGRRIIKNTGLDFGLFIPMGADIDTFVAVPWLGFTEFY
jgi:hypothetical protein